VSRTPLERFSANFDAIRKILVNVIWIAIIVIVLATLGRYWMAARSPVETTVDRPTTEAVREPIPWEAVDTAVGEAFATARDSAEAMAAERLDAWIGVLVQRVDDEFLDWYFDYWNQQVLGLQSLWFASVHRVFEEQPTAAERITEKIQAEFAIRVLKPQLAQLELENITRDVMDHYVATLQSGLRGIPTRFAIPEGHWERYLDDIALLAADTEGNRQVPVTLKTVYVAGTGGAVVLGGQAMSIATKIGSKVAVQTAGKAATQVAMKTGGKVAAKAGGKLFGPIVGVGIIAWDVWDHWRTERQNRPLLRQTLLDYFAEMKESLLRDRDAGILGAIDAIEASAFAAAGGERSE